MEFEFQKFNGRLVLNPTDLILRIEHKDTLRAYEKVFFERDYAEYLPFGGLEFIQRTLAAFFKNSAETPGLKMERFEDSPTEISFTLSYTTPITPRPILFEFEIPAQRKATADADVEGMNRRLKEMEVAFARRLAEMERGLAAAGALAERVKELEARCGDTITLPGCDYVIPVNTTNLILVKDNTYIYDEVSSAFFYSRSYPHKRSTTQTWSNGNIPGNSSGFTDVGGCSIIVDSISNIKNLKYLKSLTHLVISGIPSIRDYSILSTFTNLQTLTICSTRAYIVTHSHGQPQYSIVNGGNDAGNNPSLSDISWITSLKNLNRISFIGCKSLVNITPLKELPKLTYLNIKDTGVKNTDFLTNAGLTIIKS